MTTSAEAAVLARMQKDSSGKAVDIETAEANMGGKELPPGHQGAVVQFTDIALSTSQKTGDPNINVKSLVCEDTEGSGKTDLAGVFCGFNFWFGISDWHRKNGLTDPYGKGGYVTNNGKKGTCQVRQRSSIRSANRS